MKKTDVYDMSAGIVTVNLQELQNILGTACKNAKSECSRAQQETDSALLAMFGCKDPEERRRLNGRAASSAKYMAAHADEYARAMQAYYAIAAAAESGHELSPYIPPSL